MSGPGLYPWLQHCAPRHQGWVAGQWFMTLDRALVRGLTVWNLLIALLYRIGADEAIDRNL